MNRKAFLASIGAALFAEPGNKKSLDDLVNDLNRVLNAARFVGDTVIYERDEWDRIRELIAKIIALKRV